MGFILFMLMLLSLGGSGAWFALGRKTTITKSNRGDISEINFAIKPLRLAPGIVAAVFFFTLFLSYTTVDAGNIGIVKRFGNPVGELKPGLHFIRPFADSVTPITVQTRVVKPNETASSKDLQAVYVEVTLAYHVDPSFATAILVNLNDDAEGRVITPAILESIKAETALFDVRELVTSRARVRDGIENRVKERLLPYHIVAETTSITNFKFSDEYEKSIEAKQVAEQNAEKAKNDLTRIQVQAEQQIAQAKGEAEALRAQKEQITPELLQLRTIEMMKEKWNGVLPENYYGGAAPLPMMEVLKGTSRK
jgi:regulator of protease activity HflC (stomatin/prohibitin superfamily)